MSLFIFQCAFNCEKRVTGSTHLGAFVRRACWSLLAPLSAFPRRACWPLLAPLSAFVRKVRVMLFSLDGVFMQTRSGVR